MRALSLPALSLSKGRSARTELACPELRRRAEVIKWKNNKKTMKNKIIYFFILAVFIISPFFALADGGSIRPLPNGDFTWVDENEQQAFINYEEGTEKLIIGVDFKKENSDTAWIIPVPGDSKEVNLDITSKLPIFFGDDLMSKAKMEISEILSTSYFAYQSNIF
jgi:hypothetical protein